MLISQGSPKRDYLAKQIMKDVYIIRSGTKTDKIIEKSIRAWGIPQAPDE